MAVSRAMRRLQRVLEIQEDQYRTALDLALADLRRLQAALNASAEQGRRGRQLVLSSAATGELADRLAGLEESRIAHRRSTNLTPQIADSQAAVSERRQEFLLKRVERRKAETMIEKTEAEDAAIAGRRGQRGLDDWFLSGMRRRADE